MPVMTPYGQMPGGVATGHVPQQPNLGLGPNRYVPPTFNWGQRIGDNAPNYQQMDWNQMQAYYMPQQQNSPYTNSYMSQLQGMLGGFSRQYGGPNRQPVLPQFGTYNPGFGGPTSFYDQGRQSDMIGGFSRQYGYPQMPQFNPYMLARNNLAGMDFNQMFDPRYAMLFGMGGLGRLRPQGFEATQPQQPPSNAGGLKPMVMSGGG